MKRWGVVAAITVVLFLPVTAMATQFLPEWRPDGTPLAVSLHGDYQFFADYHDAALCNPGPGCFQLLHTLTLEPDVRLTDTFRIHARYRPFKLEPLFNSGSVKADAIGKNAFKKESLERLFVENRLWGVDAAEGLLPLEFHNLYMAQDDVLGVLAAKNNISPWGWPNARVMLFGTVVGEENRLAGREKQNVGLYGIDAVVDHSELTFEATLGHLHDSSSATLNEEHAGLSMIWLEPLRSRSLRVFGSSQQNGTGMLVISEQTYVLYSAQWDRPTLYTNLFYGTEDYRSMAAGSLKNLGFLFDPVGGSARLPNTGADAAGFAAGLLLGKSRDFTVTPEIGMLVDRARGKKNQFAVGLRTQSRLFDTSFIRLDLVSRHPSPANEIMLQAVYRF